MIFSASIPDDNVHEMLYLSNDSVTEFSSHVMILLILATIS
jgi:hypothetical protein